MSDAKGTETRVARDLDEPHRDGENLLWCGDVGPGDATEEGAAAGERSPDAGAAVRSLSFEITFSPPLPALDRAIVFGGQRAASDGVRGPSAARVRAFGLWDVAGGDPLWEERSALVRVHTPTFAEAEDMQERYAEIEASATSVAEGGEPHPGVHMPFPGWVVELSAGGARRVFVASVPRGDTLRATLDLALSGVRPEVADRLSRDEQLVVPVIRARVGGVALDLEGGGAPSSPRSTGHLLPPRQLLCQRPFLVWLSPADRLEPELVLWIESASLCEVMSS